MARGRLGESLRGGEGVEGRAYLGGDVEGAVWDVHVPNYEDEAGGHGGRAGTVRDTVNGTVAVWSCC
jgi:hypothetical protein